MYSVAEPHVYNIDCSAEDSTTTGTLLGATVRHQQPYCSAGPNDPRLPCRIVNCSVVFGCFAESGPEVLDDLSVFIERLLACSETLARLQRELGVANATQAAVKLYCVLSGRCVLASCPCFFCLWCHTMHN